ncbi:hypothetical protein ABT324_16525, partial [Saccharopolyspora sp. NPDC000359]
EDTGKLIEAAQKAAEGASSGVGTAGEVVAAVRTMVRDIIAELVGRLISWALQVLATLGIAMAWVVPQVVTAVTKTVAKIADVTTKLVKAMKSLGKLVKKLKDGFGDAKKALDKIKKDNGGGAPKADSPAPTRSMGNDGPGSRGGPDSPAPTRSTNGNGPGSRGGPDTPASTSSQSTNSSSTNAGGNGPQTSRSMANGSNPPAVVSGWKTIFGRPDKSYSAGADKNGKLVYFRRDRVQATAMKDYNGKPIGVTFQTKPSDLANKQSFANNGNEFSRQYTRLYPPGTKDTNAPGTQYRLEKMEWGKKGQDEPFYLNTHASPESFEVNMDTGESLSVQGKTFAKVTNDSKVFQSAVAENERMTGKPVSSYHLMACSAGKTDGPGGAAHDFQQTMSDRFGRKQPVYASTETDITGRGGYHGVTNGGTWRKFSGGPSTPGV